MCSKTEFYVKCYLMVMTTTMENIPVVLIFKLKSPKTWASVHIHAVHPEARQHAVASRPVPCFLGANGRASSADGRFMVRRFGQL